MKYRIFYVLLTILLLAMGFISGQRFFSKRYSHQKTVLFLCVHNAFRSQVAEAYFNKFAKEKKIDWRAKSAGFLKANEINEKAVILMAEEGIDISDKKPKLIDKEIITMADKIVVVCKECEERGFCLALPKDKEIEYWRLEDPTQMELEKAREIRDLIKEKTISLIETL